MSRVLAIFLILPLFSLGGAETKVIKPRLDPPDQPFRLAPMPEASRSIHVRLGTNLHFAFDVTLLRIHTLWEGPGLDLHGPPYTGNKSPFLARVNGNPIWKSHALFPWNAGPQPQLFKAASSGDFDALNQRNESVSLEYHLGSKPGAITIQEGMSLERIDGETVFIRRFEIGPSKEDLWFLVHAALAGESEVNGEAAVFKHSTNQYRFAVRGMKALRFQTLKTNVSFEEEIISEASTESGRTTILTEGPMTALFLKIPSHPDLSVIEILMAGSATLPAKAILTKWREAPPGKAVAASSPVSKSWSASPAAMRPKIGDEHYTLETFPVPKELDFLVGGMGWLSNGDLAVCTWPGEIYFVKNAQGSVEKATYHRFARGLCEPLGLAVHQGTIYVAQKPELTAVIDSNADGEADRFESINDDWGYSGNYHSYAFGPLIDPHGDFYLFITGQRGRWDLPYVGWAVRVNPHTQALQGYAHGLRAPNGWSFYGAERDLFVTDNQGNWIGAGKLNHLRQGAFYGFPSGQPAPESQYTNPPPAFTPPALWFPRKLAPSASDIVVVPDQRFGPFQGQMLIGDFQNSLVMRVYLEKVGGEWQGVVFPFLKGFRGAVNRLSFGPDGKLYVGGCKRAWATASPQEGALERVSFSGVAPFEIASIQAQKDGFKIIFTQPADLPSISDPENFSVSQYRYKYHSTYGSPEIDHEGKENSATDLAVLRVDPAKDGLSVTLRLKDLKEGYVTAFRTSGLLSGTGKKLRNDSAYYTLNRLPRPD